MIDCGVSTASLFCRRMNEDAVAALDALGIRCAEVFLTTYSEYGERFAREIVARKGGLRVHSVHVLNTQFEPQLFGAHPRAKADAFAMLRTAMEGARIMGAQYYTFHAVSRLKKNASPIDADKTGARMCEVAAACAEHKVTLCLENVHWALYNEPGIFSALKARCPALHGVLDIKQARLSGYPYPMYIKDMEGSIAHVHISDVGEDGKMCLPGQGITDFSQLIARLLDAGFDGALLIEVYPGDFAAEEELRRSCEYVEELVYKLSR